MSVFCCPVCGRPLTLELRTLCCENGHRFDLARSGYVNLLRSQRSASVRHGDDKRMLAARRLFLDSGHYARLRDLLTYTVAREVKEGVLLDAGCGEGYYTAFLAEQIPSLRVGGIDISKDALHMCAARSKTMELAVASVFALPLRDAAVDAVVSVFAPCADAEFARVLRPGGILIRVIPTERHLFGLKAAVYKEPRLNKPERTEVAGFTLRHRQELSWELSLDDPDDIRHLFEMTPYYYKTGQEDQERLLSRSQLTTEVAFAILTYEKL